MKTLNILIAFILICSFSFGQRNRVSADIVKVKESFVWKGDTIDFDAYLSSTDALEFESNADINWSCFGDIYEEDQTKAIGPTFGLIDKLADGNSFNVSMEGARGYLITDSAMTAQINLDGFAKFATTTDTVFFQIYVNSAGIDKLQTRFMSRGNFSISGNYALVAGDTVSVYAKAISPGNLKIDAMNLNIFKIK